MSRPTKARTHPGIINGFPTWEVVVPEEYVSSDGTGWESEHGMPCELIAQTHDHMGYRVRVRFLLDDAAEPYGVQVARVELEDNRHEEVDGERHFTGYGKPRPPSRATKAIESLRLSGLAGEMHQAFQYVTLWDRAAETRAVDAEQLRKAAARAFDPLTLVADVYNRADRYPLRAVMQELGLPKSTAALRVRQAKDDGLIPQVAEP